jgi:hypothetical protein
MTRRLILLLTLCALWPRDAHAYLDPGTGSYVLQIIIGVAVGAALAVKVFWLRIKAFFSGLFSKNRGGR